MPDYTDTSFVAKVDTLRTSTSTLNSKDASLVLGQKKVDYAAEGNEYLGGFFGESQEDYVEVLVYDINDNFLEASIVNKDDYVTSSTGVKLKTGTILRRLGYDRGKFKVKYNFLRRLAGSHETILVKKDDNTIYTDDFNIETDINRIGTDLVLKENKYTIHAISPTRKEVRIIPQHIKDHKYIRDFFNLSNKKKKIKSDGNDASRIQFNTNETLANESSTMEFLDGNNKFTSDMVGGILRIPDVFLRKVVINPWPINGEDVFQNHETIADEESATFEAQFFISADPDNRKITNTQNSHGDYFFYEAIRQFRDLDEDDIIQDTTGVDFQKNPKVLKNVRNLSDSKFNCPYFKFNEGVASIIDFQSNSIVDANVTTEYIWEVTGWDKDTESHWWHGDEHFWFPVQPKFNSAGTDQGGNIEIMTGPDDSYASPSPTNLLIGLNTVEPGPGGDNPANARNPSRIRVAIHGKDCHIGIKLTIRQNTRASTSTLHLPAIVETHKA